jgi:DNA-directed RNA polymerase I subunit RPA2
LAKAQVPPSNKLAKHKEILPAECRERHVSYRGRLSATLEYRINGGDPVEFVREFGQVPIMLKVAFVHLLSSSMLTNGPSQIDATSRTTRQNNS